MTVMTAVILARVERGSSATSPATLREAKYRRSENVVSVGLVAPPLAARAERVVAGRTLLVGMQKEV